MSLQPVLETAWQQIGRQTVRISELETENELLKQQLANATCDTPDHDNTSRRKRRRSNRSGTEIQDDSQVSRQEYDNIAEKYERLKEQYQKLSRAHQRHLELFDRVQQKYKEAKHYCREWKKYYTAHLPSTSTLKTPEHHSFADVSVGHNSEDLALGYADKQDAPLSSKIKTEASQSPKVKAEPPPSPRVKSEDEETPRQSRRLAHGSSQSTDSELESAIDSVYQGISSPVTVSTRSLRRSRPRPVPQAEDSIVIKQENGLPSLPMQISSQSGSNSEPTKEQKFRLFHQSSDLDVTHTLTTPRKYRRTYDSRNQRRLSEGHPRGFLRLLSRVTSSLSDGGADDLRQTKMENGSVPNHSPSAHHSTVFQPISVNVITPSSSALREANTKKRKLREEDIAGLAEDGDSVTHVKAEVTKDKSTTVTDERHRRLASLLDGPNSDSLDAHADFTADRTRRVRQSKSGSSKPSDKATESSVLISHIKPLSSVGPGVSPRSARLDQGVRSSNLDNDMKDETRVSTPAAAHPARPQPSFATPGETPLRERPLKSLRLDDFKINPEYAGSDFAFTETIRGKEARRCLPGCTRPECCGTTFLRTIEMGGGAGTAATSHLNDVEVFEEYWGVPWQTVARNLSADEQQRKLADARARTFALQFGKHRQVFERHSTPPGFWRTDMPSTQELADDRAKASQMEKTTVQERWMEALRPGGRWSFRDE